MIFSHPVGSARTRCWPRVMLLAQAGGSWKALNSTKEAEVKRQLVLCLNLNPHLRTVYSQIFFSDSHCFSQTFFESVKWYTWLCNLMQNITGSFLYCHLIDLGYWGEDVYIFCPHSSSPHWARQFFFPSSDLEILLGRSFFFYVKENFR